MSRTELPPRFDRTRPEPAHVQAAIQHAAATKRARKAAKRQRNAELTVLGREVSAKLAAWIESHRRYVHAPPGRLFSAPFAEARAAAWDAFEDAHGRQMESRGQRRDARHAVYRSLIAQIGGL